MSSYPHAQLSCGRGCMDVYGGRLQLLPEEARGIEEARGFDGKYNQRVQLYWGLVGCALILETQN